jgi:hypothetical protein
MLISIDIHEKYVQVYHNGNKQSCFTYGHLKPTVTEITNYHTNHGFKHFLTPWAQALQYAHWRTVTHCENSDHQIAATTNHHTDTTSFQNATTGYHSEIANFQNEIAIHQNVTTTTKATSNHGSKTQTNHSARQATQHLENFQGVEDELRNECRVSILAQNNEGQSHPTNQNYLIPTAVF